MMLNFDVAEKLNNFKLTEDNLEEYLTICSGLFKQNKKKAEVNDTSAFFFIQTTKLFCFMKSQEWHICMISNL